MLSEFLLAPCIFRVDANCANVERVELLPDPRTALLEAAVPQTATTCAICIVQEKELPSICVALVELAIKHMLLVQMLVPFSGVTWHGERQQSFRWPLLVPK